MWLVKGKMYSGYRDGTKLAFSVFEKKLPSPRGKELEKERIHRWIAVHGENNLQPSVVRSRVSSHEFCTGRSGNMSGTTTCAVWSVTSSLQNRVSFVQLIQMFLTISTVNFLSISAHPEFSVSCIRSVRRLDSCTWRKITSAYRYFGLALKMDNWTMGFRIQSWNGKWSRILDRSLPEFASFHGPATSLQGANNPKTWHGMQVLQQTLQDFVQKSIEHHNLCLYGVFLMLHPTKMIGLLQKGLPKRIWCQCSMKEFKH